MNWPPDRETATGWLSAISAVILLSAGVVLAFANRLTTATAAWGFGFLFVILLLLSKFKRFKGFGFEAEMWEEKQIEAAALIDQLKSASQFIGRQAASLVPKTTLSVSELGKGLEEMRQQLNAMDMPATEREKALQPLYQRIEDSYLRLAMDAVVDSAVASRGGHVFGAYSESEFHLSVMEEETKRQESATFLRSSSKSFEELISFVDASKMIANKVEIIDNLKKIERDYQFFRTHRSLHSGG
jgi:hypothetical protein